MGTRGGAERVSLEDEALNGDEERWASYRLGMTRHFVTLLPSGGEDTLPSSCSISLLRLSVTFDCH